MPGHYRASATSKIWGQGIKYPPGVGNRQQNRLPQPGGTRRKKVQGIIFSKDFTRDNDGQKIIVHQRYIYKIGAKRLLSCCQFLVVNALKI